MESTPERESSRPATTTYLLSAACLVVVVAGLKAASQILVPLMVALLVSFASLPLLFWLRRHRIPSLPAVLVTILADVAVLAAVALLVSTSINDLARELPKYQARFEELGEEAVVWLEERRVPVREWLQLEQVEEAPAARLQVVDEPGGADDPPDEPPAQAWWVNLFDLGSIVDLTNRALRGVAAALSNAVVVVLITTFILAEAATFRDKLRFAFGHLRWAERLANVSQDLRRYLGIKTAVSIATGLLIGFWVYLLDIDFAFLWGLTAFALNYIPNIGSILAALPTLVLALIQHGPGIALLVLLGYLVVNVLLGNLLEPMLLGRRLGLSTLVVFLSLVFWGWLWGPVGMLLSVPLTMSVKILLENSSDWRWLAVLMGDSPQRARRRLRLARRLGREESAGESGPAATEPVASRAEP